MNAEGDFRLQDISGILRRRGKVAGFTALFVALAAYWILQWSWELSLLFGTLVIVTGPTVIRPLLRNVPLRSRLSTVLEAEGVLIDPIGAIVAAVTLQIVIGPSLDSFASGIAL